MLHNKLKINSYFSIRVCDIQLSLYLYSVIEYINIYFKFSIIVRYVIYNAQNHEKTDIQA